MIYVHGDVSGKADSGVIASGCYLGRAEHWQCAADGWGTALASEKIGVFHATDFYASEGAFAAQEWKHEVNGRWIPGGAKHDEFAARITAVAENAGLIGFAFGMNPATFAEHLRPVFALVKRKVRCTDAQLFAIMTAIKHASDFLDAADTPIMQLGRGRVIFEDEHGSGLWIDFFNESRNRREAWTKWFGALTTAPKEIIPVQIADLLAHEVWRRVSEVFKDNPRPIRKSFARMLVNERIEVQMLTEETAKETAELLRGRLAKYPDGLVPPSPAGPPSSAALTVAASVATSALVSWAVGPTY